MAGKRPPPAMLAGRALHLRLFGYFKGIIDSYAQVAHGTLELSMPKEQLNGGEVLAPPIDQRCLGSGNVDKNLKILEDFSGIHNIQRIKRIFYRQH
jgi:hypothetical protein